MFDVQPFTKRELYLIANAIHDRKNDFMDNHSENNKIKMSRYDFDEYFELSTLHLKIKDLINER